MSFAPRLSETAKLRRPLTARPPHVLRLQAAASQPGARTSGFAQTGQSSLRLPRSVHQRSAQRSARSDTLYCTATGGGDGPPDKPPKKPPQPSKDDDEDEPLYNEEEAEQVAREKNIQLPEDFLEAARGEGLRKSVLDTFIELQKGWLTRFICNSSRFFRDRLLYDPRFLFIVLAEIAIDTACATIAEVRKRGEDFWSEFEFYLSDLTVGLVLDVLLVGLMATPAVISKHHVAHNATGFRKLLARTPNAVFEPNTAGEPAYTLFQRLFCLVVKFGEYSTAGIVCGIVGQAVANLLMKAKRTVVGEHKDDVDMPPVIMTGLTWGAFMGGSSNLRYQSIFAVERLVDKTIAKQFPKAPYVVSFILRLINNIWGGENFIDHARWTGIQPSADDGKD